MLVLKNTTLHPIVFNPLMPADSAAAKASTDAAATTSVKAAPTASASAAAVFSEICGATSEKLQPVP